MVPALLDWVFYFLAGVATIGGGILYSWFIERTRLYKPEADLNAKRVHKLFEEGTPDQIAYFIAQNVFLACIIAPIVEELVFRQWLMSYFLPLTGFFLAALFTTLLWAAGHIWYSQPWIPVVGFIYAWVWLEFGVLFCIILHMANNIIATVFSIYEETKRLEGRQTLILV
jgi:membrane protease YdiL (CAAX protease family)